MINQQFKYSLHSRRWTYRRIRTLDQVHRNFDTVWHFLPHFPWISDGTIVTYASEKWVLKETTIQKLLVFERKILRRIFGPTKENQIWRIKTNEELDKLIKHKNIVNHIKAQRLSWFSHVKRIPHIRTVKKIFKWNPLPKRSQGRPKYRWEDSVKQDTCQMRVKNWITCVQDRGKWKNIVEKAITFNH